MLKTGISRRHISLPDEYWVRLDALVAEQKGVPGFVVVRAAMREGLRKLRARPDLIVTSGVARQGEEKT